ncbi:hypothetical protein SLV14_000167 [Streptomyces sp. Je 1-4]|uniref:hypothetical protein n=1 Tax=Streptomyces TaxID=1883 RepID=UPI0021D91FC4|nr:MULTISPECIES: hypothetical protein [unclassified Streptomyces]UYB45099.1 hypothetical protein SLV14_000167 [Streptomyces sp. Je 1-4]UZQ33798.1 hypothetical protein SLV14N_000167 [Streptomyces sp. Je 1-4] [Streptomyces sp. Je 1-4 4N24]UZQ41216.1 hypothetical protein SLV14NA_000167 [Streptomyces sp. Je 1-4] [Streptomyces sp. Je 1-4 4N24_ara]
MKPPGTVLVPLGVVTTTGQRPGVPGGVMAVIWVPAGLTMTLEAGRPQRVTVAPIRSVPVMVTNVPPATGPWAGVMLDVVGAAT